MAKQYGIKLRRYGVQNVNQEYYACFRIRIEVLDAHDMPSQIFLYKRSPINTYDNTYTDEFQTICSPVDLAEYPVDNPLPNLQYQFLRKNFLEVDMRAQIEVDEFWASIQAEVCRLVSALQAADKLAIIDEFSCGVLPTAADSSSISISS